MSVQIGSKINQLLRSWPRGTVAVHRWLAAQGITRQLAEKYRQGSWIEPIGPGAFIRKDDQVAWTGAVFALQKHLGLHVHVGSKTALEFWGQAHFLPMSGGIAWILGEPHTRLPSWFLRRKWSVRIRFATASLFAAYGLGLESQTLGDFAISLSSRERAILELLHFVPRAHSVDDARHVVEGLTTLRPELMQRLLEECRSIKVKRLFLYLAEGAGHPWFSRLDVTKIDLGRGKRQVTPGGVLDPKYLITVPKRSEEEA
jgi:hypothetical protein